MRRLWVPLTAAALFILAWTQWSELTPRQETGVFPIDPPTPYTHYFPQNTPKGAVLVIHGLDANRMVMTLISSAFADAGFEVYAIDLPGHGDSANNFEAGLAETAVQNAITYLGKPAIVVGHSLGAGLLLDLAASQHFAQMVLLAPPPMPLEQIQAERVLIATGDIDVPRIREFAAIAQDIGSPRVQTLILPWAAHTTPILSPEYISRFVAWSGGSGGTRSAARLAWFVLMLAGTVVFGLGFAARAGDSAEPAAAPSHIVLVPYIGACSIAILVLKLVNPMEWIHLFGTDYLIGFVLISGLLLAANALRDYRGGRVEKLRQPDWKATAAVLLSVIYVIAGIGFGVMSRMMHMTLSGSRWWRFPCIVAAGLPLFVCDEFAIRPIRPAWRSNAVGLLTRILMLAFLLAGVLILNRESAFMVLMTPPIMIFWLALWFAAGVVSRFTRHPFATALFSALVQAWAFAAWFVTT